jgi:hypothetical protein
MSTSTTPYVIRSSFVANAERGPLPTPQNQAAPLSIQLLNLTPSRSTHTHIYRQSSRLRLPFSKLTPSPTPTHAPRGQLW